MEQKTKKPKNQKNKKIKKPKTKTDTLNRMGEDKLERNKENNNTTDNSETHGGGRE